MKENHKYNVTRLVPKPNYKSRTLVQLTRKKRSSKVDYLLVVCVVVVANGEYRKRARFDFLNQTEERPRLIPFNDFF